ncbi:MAG: type IV toxin-antitoxin system AbiEi family antitoxin domain-containing protein [Terriglobales bacterium]
MIVGNMMPLCKDYAKQVYEIAESQDGYFTAKQALASGYSDRMQTYHVKNGDWIRESRGIFRLASYPPVQEPELMVWYLWSCNRAGVPQSVYSHDTALQIYSLSSWNSQNLHMTVPPGFRRMVVPDVLRLHHRHLHKRDIAVRYSVPVTKPLKTIVDLLIDGHTPRKYIEEALEEALDQNLILKGEIADANLTEQERTLFEDLMRKTA